MLQTYDNLSGDMGENLLICEAGMREKGGRGYPFASRCKGAAWTKKYSWVLLCSLVSAQVVSGIVEDSTGEPIPFVIIQNIRTQQGTYTDLQGRFSVRAVLSDTLEVRALGYETQRLPAARAGRIRLAAKSIEVSPVVIRASDNPAYPIIRAVQAARSRWNPLNMPHAYRSYNKLTVSLPDSIRSRVNDSLPTYLTIWETETYKVYIDAGRTQEKLLSQRISGNLPVQSFFSPTSLQPLGIYESWISLLDKRFVSPIGPLAFSYYDYELIDTLYQGEDTLYHIRFFPLPSKSSWGMSGHLYVAAPDYALASVEGEVRFTQAEATTASAKAFFIQQVYRKWRDSLWFPVQLHSEAYLEARLSQRPLELLVKTRSYLRDIEIPPGVKPPTGQRILLPAEVPALAERERAEPLTPEEIQSYHLLDSLIARSKVGRMRFLLDVPALLSGRVPVGALNLLLRPLLLYHAGEGWRPQVGIETSDKVLAQGRLRIWGGYGTGRQAGLLGTPWRYGTEIEVGQTALLRLSMSDDVVERTMPRLIDERPALLPLMQSAYEPFARGYGLGWGSLVRQREIGVAARALCFGRLWLIGEGKYVQRQAPGIAAVSRYLIQAGMEILPRENLLVRGSMRWRLEVASPRVRIRGGWLTPPQGWDAKSYFGEIDLLHQWAWGRWAQVTLRLSTGVVGSTVPELWHHHLRTLSQNFFLSQPYTLAAHPYEAWGRYFAYGFLVWEIPNNRFPKAQVWTPTLGLIGQGAYLDSKYYPEVGFRLRSWLPQSISRYVPPLGRLALCLYKGLSFPFSEGWAFRVEVGF